MKIFVHLDTAKCLLYVKKQKNNGDLLITQ